MPVISEIISEYESVDLDLSRAQAEALLSTEVVDVSPAPGNRWKVTAKSIVGSVVVDGVHLLIRPKINPENLFMLLEPGLPPNAWRKEAFAYDGTSDLLPSVIAFFARTVETTLGRGVLRSYESRQESLVALRGRLDVAGQFSRAGMITPIACTFDEFTEDIVENRVLRAAVRVALRVPHLRPGERQRLMQILVKLEGVSEETPHPDAVDQIHITRLNEYYLPALRLAQLILTNLSLAAAHGTVTTSSFTVDMNELFERFVTERLRQELRGSLRVDDALKVHLGHGRRVQMKPDLVFRDQHNVIRHVGDVKYKVTTDARGRSSDHYQLLAYTTALDLTAGTLIYCRRRDDVEQRSVTVKNVGTTLVVRSLDLSGSPEQVGREVSDLAILIRGLVDRSAGKTAQPGHPA